MPTISIVQGGCNGNNNNFETESACQNTCGNDKQNVDRISEDNALPNKCQLPKEIGQCLGSFERYFYNNESGRCEEFYYGKRLNCMYSLLGF